MGFVLYTSVTQLAFKARELQELYRGLMDRVEELKMKYRNNPMMDQPHEMASDRTPRDEPTGECRAPEPTSLTLPASVPSRAVVPDVKTKVAWSKDVGIELPAAPQALCLEEAAGTIDSQSSTVTHQECSLRDSGPSGASARIVPFAVPVNGEIQSRT